MRRYPRCGVQATVRLTDWVHSSADRLAHGTLVSLADLLSTLYYPQLPELPQAASTGRHDGCGTDSALQSLCPLSGECSLLHMLPCGCIGHFPATVINTSVFVSEKSARTTAAQNMRAESAV